MWQSLGFGPNYKAAYCMSVCPAGEDVIGPYLTDRPGHLRDVVASLQDKEETIYVVAARSEDHVARRFRTKQSSRSSNGGRPPTIPRFFRAGSSRFSLARRRT